MRVGKRRTEERNERVRVGKKRTEERNELEKESDRGVCGKQGADILGETECEVFNPAAGFSLYCINTERIELTRTASAFT